MPSYSSGHPFAAYRPNQHLDAKAKKFLPEFLDEVTVNHEEDRRPDAFVFDLGMAVSPGEGGWGRGVEKV